MSAQRERLLGVYDGKLPEWCFPSPGGHFWMERNFSRTWERLRDQFPKEIRPLPFHCTRHTFISWALEGGTPAKRVADWVGATVETIEAHYSHAIPEVESTDGFLEPKRRQGSAPVVGTRPNWKQVH